VTGVAAGILPALRSTRSSALSSRSATGGRRDLLRRTLVVVQVAASLALVVSTGLLVRALTRLHENAPGFAATSSTLVFRTTLPFPKYENTATRERFYEQVLGELRSLPGVRHAGVMTVRPMGDFRGGIWPVRVMGTIKDSQISSRFVTPELFRALGVPLLRGRDFLPSDGPSSLPVAVVSQSFVDQHWPGESGLGRTFEVRIGNRVFTIVGVAANVRFRGFEGQSEPQMYLASSQMQDGWFSFFTPKDFVVSTSLEDPTSLTGPLRRIVNSIDPVQQVSDIQTITMLLEADTASRRVQLWVVGAFAAAAFLLAAVGIHGLLSFAVAQRTPEIGLRRALGAATQQIAGMVLGEAVALCALGCLIGSAVAYLVAQSMVTMLAGVPPADGWTIGMAAGVLTLMTIAGAILPATRAIRIDPATALRAD
jgi:predicted permease